MIDLEEATRRVIDGVGSGGEVEVDLPDSVGCYTREAIRASCAIPGFDQSAVDGYAINHDAPVAGAKLHVVGSSQAGDKPDRRIRPREAIRLFTGAPVPDGSVGIVMQEYAKLSPDGTELTLRSSVRRDEWIRRAGSAVCVGQSIVGQGTLITSALVGMLASQGRHRVTVGTKPRISIVSTGDELANAGAKIGVGQTHDSNGPMIEAMCRQLGIPAVTRYRCEDSLGATKDQIAAAAEGSDMVILTGGVSVGDHDYVKPALVESGFSIEFWRVRVKPGKPVLFARRVEDCKSVLALPGNPVSAFVCFLLFGIPAIRRWMGARPEECQLQLLPTLLAADIRNDGDRPHFVRGRVDVEGFWPLAGQESHALRSAATANALLKVESNASFRRGDRVAIIALPTV